MTMTKVLLLIFFSSGGPHGGVSVTQVQYGSVAKCVKAQDQLKREAYLHNVKAVCIEVY